MRINAVKEKLRAGEPSFGFWCMMGSPVVVEYVADAGFEWIVLDTQHGYFSYEQTLQSLQVLRDTQTIPLARVTWNDFALIGRLLDAGAMGLVVPMINTRQDAERMVDAMRYPPEGSRSAGGGRLRAYGADYMTEGANREILTIPMIETAEAVSHVDEILTTPGVDCAFIGPGDLAISLGCFGKLPNDEHEAALQRVLASGRRHGVPIGLYCQNPEDTNLRIAQGFQFVTCWNDEIILRQGAEGVRDAIRAD